MKHRHFFFLSMLCLWLTGPSHCCFPFYDYHPPVESATDLVGLAALSSGKVNLELLKLLIPESHQNDQLNVLFSPVGVSASLAMVAMASSGKSKAEIERIFEFDVLNSLYTNAVHLIYKRVGKLNFQNSLDAGRAFFSDTGLYVRNDLQLMLRLFYNEPLWQVPFKSGQAEGIINRWAQQKTLGKISEAIPPGLLKTERLIVVCAMALNVIWKEEFNASRTLPAPFHVNSCQTKYVDMMDKVSELRYYHDSYLKFQLLEIPYSSDYLSMVILLPDEIEGLLPIIKNLNIQMLTDIYHKMTDKKVHVKLPKFKLESAYFFKQTLQKLGVNDVFSSGASLWGVSSPDYSPVNLNQVKLLSYMQVDEKGIQGKAANALPKSPPGYSYVPDVHFIVDRPFFFVVFDTVTGFVAFAGTIYVP